MRLSKQSKWVVYGIVIAAFLMVGGSAWAQDAVVTDACGVSCCNPCGYTCVTYTPCCNWGCYAPCYTPCYPSYGCCGGGLFGLGLGLFCW